MAGDTRTIEPGTTIDMRTLEPVEITDPNHRELALRLQTSIALKTKWGPPELRKADNVPVVLRHPEPQKIKRSGSL